MKNKTLKKVLVYLVLLAALVIFLFPVYWMVMSAFRHNNGLMQRPLNFKPTFDTFQNMAAVLSNGKYLRFIKNSLIVSAGTMLSCVVLSLMAGYALSRYRFPFRKTIMSTLLSVQMFPTVAILITLYTFFVQFKLTNTYLGLILACLCVSLPLSVWMMKSFFDTIPVSLDEAAKIDGCGRFQTLVDVILPMMKPGIYAVGIYFFLMAWDDFVFSKVLINVNDKKTLTVGIAESFLGEFSHNYAGMMALAVVAALPIVIIFIVFQKFLISGMTAGAVKE